MPMVGLLGAVVGVGAGAGAPIAAEAAPTGVVAHTKAIAAKAAPTSGKRAMRGRTSACIDQRRVEIATECRRGHRTGEEEALPHIATELAQPIGLGFGFDALGNRAHVEFLGQADD